MKTTKFFAAALALLSVLSCQKEEPQVINDPANEEVTLITCSFAANDEATKTTTTDGKTPLWAAGDKVMIYDGVSNNQELTLAASGTASTTTGIICDTNATKFVFVKPSGWANVYAIYPSGACVSDFSASEPKLNFAGQDGTFGKANICAAAESAGQMSFKNVGAILKFPSKPATVTDILIPVAGLAKDYTVSFSGNIPALTSADATNSKSYSIGSGTGEIYIGVPAENLAAGNNIIYQDSNKDILGSYNIKANNIETNKIYTLPAIVANGTMPAGILSKKAISVSATEKVYFSQGNLYYDGTAWYFENKQCDYRLYTGLNCCINGTKSDNGTPTGHWGSFGFSTAANNYGMCTSDNSDDYTGDFIDWGKNAIENGGKLAGQWRTLSQDECKYLLNPSGRPQASRFAKAKLNNGVTGLIIFPDGYTGTTSGDGIASINSITANFPTSSIAAQTWTSMESAGCLFLSAAGMRQRNTIGTMYATGKMGVYSTSLGIGMSNGFIGFYDGTTSYTGGSDYIVYWNSRYDGRCVRLIYPAQ